MHRSGEFEPQETFECDDYLYASEQDANLFALLLKDFGIYAPARVLDVGCGVGTMVRSLRLSGYEAYGIESRGVVPADGLFLFREDARRTHFPENFFDAIVDRLTLDQLAYINRKGNVASGIVIEGFRVAKPGAYWVTTGLGSLRAAGIEKMADGPILSRYHRAYGAYRFR